MSDDDLDRATKDYRIVAAAHFRRNEEWQSRLAGFQVDYGKWLVSSLFLIHSSAIAGILYQNAGLSIEPVKWFLAGLVCAFACGFCAWWNFTLAVTDHYWRAPLGILVDREQWPEPKRTKIGIGITVTLWTANVLGIGSMACLVVGVLQLADSKITKRATAPILMLASDAQIT